MRGSFTDLDANLVVGDTLADTSVTGLVWTESIDTGISRRDDHIRSRSIVDVQRRPAMTFRSSSIVETDDRWLLEGEVTVAGVTKPVHLDVELVGVDCVEDGRQHARFESARRGAPRRLRARVRPVRRARPQSGREDRGRPPPGRAAVGHRRDWRRFVNGPWSRRRMSVQANGSSRPVTDRISICGSAMCGPT